MGQNRLTSNNPQSPIDPESDDTRVPVPDQSQLTLYKIADTEIRKAIASYLKLVKATSGLATVSLTDLEDERARTILLAGLGVRDEMTAEDALEEWKRRQAIPFELETAIAAGVYRDIRKAGADFLNVMEIETANFSAFSPEFINKNPHLLPLFQHLSGIFSKAALKTQVGSVSDNSISKPASLRLSKLLHDRVDPKQVNKGEILQRLESTLEGIVRDLIGRVLFESIVDRALSDQGLRFQREEEYDSMQGVIYDFRADFVLPTAERPLAFIEVRKSSARHASLYAKDKMFSAINWKGKNPDLLAVLVIDGPWTGETLRVLANVFDYVVPIARVGDLAVTLDAYLKGDKSKLKWLIEFKITVAPGNS
ncbi:MAG: hypothetical protein ACLQM6_14410 [Acidobacteriaceae bacterium]